MIFPVDTSIGGSALDDPCGSRRRVEEVILDELKMISA